MSSSTWISCRSASATPCPCRRPSASLAHCAVTNSLLSAVSVGRAFPRILFRLLNFFGTGALLPLLVIGPRVLRCSVGLLILPTELIIFQTDQNLAFFHFVALFHANPLHPACDLGVHVDLVMGHDVAGGREHDAAKVAILGGSTSDLDFGSVGRQQSIHQRGKAQQRHNRDADNDVTLGPRRWFAFAALS